MSFDNLDNLFGIQRVVFGQHRQHVDQRFAVEGQICQRRCVLFDDFRLHLLVLVYYPYIVDTRYVQHLYIMYRL